MATKPKNDERQERLVSMNLEELNHDKAVLKGKIHERGKQLRKLQKEVGELNEAYAQIDLEMLRRDETYKQLELKMKAEAED